MRHTRTLTPRLILPIVGILLLTASTAETSVAREIPDSLRNMSVQALFDKANIQIELKEYARALTLFHAIEQRDQVSGPLYLNMGLAYIHRDSLGLAKYYFLKAEDYPETAPGAAKGIDYVDVRLAHNEALLPPLPWERFFGWIRDGIGIHTLLFLGLFLLNIGVVIGIAGWLQPARRKWYRWPARGFISIGIVVIVLSLYTDYRARRYDQAIQIVKETNVREKPTREAGIVSLSYEGYRFRVDHSRSESQPGWYYVRMGNGQFGWVSRNDIKLL